MGGDLCQGRQPDRLGRDDQQFQGAVLVVVLEQAVEGQHGGEKGRNPQNSGGHAGQQVGVRADAEGKKRRRDHEENDHRHRVAELAQGDADIPRDKGAERVHTESPQRVSRSSA